MTHRPVRVVVDSRLRTPPDALVLRSQAPEEAIVLCAGDAPAARRRRLERLGTRLVTVPGRSGHLDLRAGWKSLARLGINELLVEGGGGLAAALLRARLIDELHLLLAPRLIGGDGRPVLGSLGVEHLQRAVELSNLELRRIGRDLLVRAKW